MRRPLRDLRCARDWVMIGALRGALIGGVLPVVYGVAFVAFRSWQASTAPPYQGQTSVSYQNTPGGAWGYAVVTAVYVGVLLLIAASGAATVGLLVGASLGFGASVIDRLVRGRLSPSVTAAVVIAAVTAVTYPLLADRRLLELDPDPWVFLVAVPMTVGLMSVWALPLRRLPS